MDLVKNGRQFRQARTLSLFTTLVNEQADYYGYALKQPLTGNYSNMESK